MTSPAIVHSTREQWKLRRRGYVTASDCAAVAGADERRGPLAVWIEKMSDVETEETIPMRRGRRLEAAIAEEYGEQTGRSVTPWPAYEILPHPTISFIGATLDATTVVDAAPIPLEIKLALGSARDWSEEPPLGYQVQTQVQAQCFGAPLAALAGLVGPGPLKTYDLERDDAFFAALVPQLERFWWHVANRIPPEADGKPGTSAAIRRLWANEDGETVPLDAEALGLVSEWEGAKAREEAAKDTADELENKLRARLGSASFGALPDGSYLTLKLTKRDGYEVSPTSFRALRRWHPRFKRG